MIPTAIFVGLIVAIIGGLPILANVLLVLFRIVFAALTWLILALTFVAFWAFDRPKAVALWKRAGA